MPFQSYLLRKSDGSQADDRICSEKIHQPTLANKPPKLHVLFVHPCSHQNNSGHSTDHFNNLSEKVCVEVSSAPIITSSIVKCNDSNRSPESSTEASSPRSTNNGTHSEKHDCSGDSRTETPSYLSPHSKLDHHGALDCTSTSQVETPPSPAERNNENQKSFSKKLQLIANHGSDQLNTSFAMQRFLSERSEAPWILPCLRSSGGISGETCGKEFPGVSRRERLKDHLQTIYQEGHYLPTKAVLPMPHTLHTSCGRNNRKLRKSHSVDHLDNHNKPKLARNLNFVHFRTMGAWSNEGLPTKDNNGVLSRCSRRRHLSFLLNVVNPHDHPGRSNNFFNGLEIVIGNLLEKYPHNDVVRGLLNAVTLLEQLLCEYRTSHDQTLIQPSPKSVSLSSSSALGSIACASSTNQDTRAVSSCGESPTGGNKNSLTFKESSQINSTEDTAPNSSPEISRKFSHQDKPLNSKRLLACPIKKNDEVYGKSSQCRFEGAATMSYVVQHVRSGMHRQFLTLCRVCWGYSTTVEEYRIFHNDGNCQQAVQPRGSRVAGHWQNLYFTMFPHSLRVPSPYIGDQEWSMKQVPHPFITAYDDTQGNSINAIDHDYHSAEGYNLWGNFSSTVDFQTLTQHHQSQNATEQRGEDAGLELFSRMLSQHTSQGPEPGDLMSQIMNTTGQLQQHETDEIADHLFTRANALFRSPQYQTGTMTHDPNTNQDFFGNGDFWMDQFTMTNAVLSQQNSVPEVSETNDDGHGIQTVGFHVQSTSQQCNESTASAAASSDDITLDGVPDDSWFSYFVELPATLYEPERNVML